MRRSFQTVDSLQRELKRSIYESIENKLIEVVYKTIQKYIQKNVYDAYAPSGGEFSYDRTYELLEAISIENFTMGAKYARFEIVMDGTKLNARVNDDYWNAHANVWGGDETDYIPLWIEEGTSGSLWDREGAYYMADSMYELSGGKLATILSTELRKQGWDVKVLG